MVRRPKARKFIQSMAWLADAFAEKQGVARDDIVVFYPAGRKELVGSALRHRHVRDSERWRESVKGLVICPSPSLKSVLVAFRIEDVRAGRTPAKSTFEIGEFQ
jgi:hypothetical protein